MQSSGNADLPPWARVAAFVFGIVFIGVLLGVAIYIRQPSSFQIFVFRTVLALAAAGVSSLIPGLLDIKLGGWLQAGGAMAVFVMVFQVNPPALVNAEFSPEYRERVTAGDAALDSGNFTAASGFYTSALEIYPAGLLALHGRGKAHYHLEEYEEALEDYDRALVSSSFESDPRLRGSILVATALALEAEGRLEESLERYERALRALGPDDVFGRDQLYDIGRLHFILWRKRGAPSETDDYRASLDALQGFLARNGKPRRWAEYHLACLHAARAADSALPDTKRSELVSSALSTFEAASSELAQSASRKADDQRRILRRLLENPEAELRRAGDPVGCPGLVELLVNRGELPGILKSLA